ncbi:tetratricopeptide repeat protein [Chamaesiphon sp. VAR_69_metabat_338]|uniref:tetratricopeptide repeat protein n=1 Tax=Chamaesiphon sp. VAR_69_metabat_338 TaxID=2964704 RepID=UPI00286DA1BF|nr:tetratricopeptide repeat protein [Chamaesiphon sp. VAR_69_metabat_338]
MDRSANFNNDSAWTQFQLANAWQLEGDFENAMSCYQEAVRLQPNYFPAYQRLGDLMFDRSRFDEALEYYDRSLSLDFEATDLSYYYRCLGLVKVIKPEYTSFAIDKTSPLATGKIDLGQQRIFGVHRSGWNFAIQALKSLHNPHGILFDGYLDDNFLFQHERLGLRSQRMLAKMQVDGVFEQFATSAEKGIVPYQQPWVGFLHSPQSMPLWFNYPQRSPQKLFEKEIWQASLPYCLGLFSLSEYHAQWLREQTGKPVSVLTHPTEIPDRKFEFERFITNPHKKVVQIGWWLRKLNSIDRLPLAEDNSLGYQKVRIGSFFDLEAASFANLLKLEARIYKIEVDEIYRSNTVAIDYVSNDEYDDLLSMNIAFVDLYDASANNAIVECIARATPLLINPLTAVREYLGADYPMYFDNLNEAAEKAVDTALILETHEYLKKCQTSKKLSENYFLTSFQNSEVYLAI